MPSQYHSNEECLGGIYKLLRAEMSEKKTPEGSQEAQVTDKLSGNGLKTSHLFFQPSN